TGKIAKIVCTVHYDTKIIIIVIKYLRKYQGMTMILKTENFTSEAILRLFILIVFYIVHIRLFLIVPIHSVHFVLPFCYCNALYSAMCVPRTMTPKLVTTYRKSYTHQPTLRCTCRKRGKKSDLRRNISILRLFMIISYIVHNCRPPTLANFSASLTLCTTIGNLR
ncbi:hypothetical protein L9F63_024008, partial [Diploptera punctata]